MKLKYFLTSQHERLRNAIDENLHLQRYNSNTPWIEEYFKEERFDAETSIEDNLPALVPSPKPACDLENVKLLYPALSHLTVEQAMDSRFWSHLTHIKYWDYMRIRWGGGECDTVEKIKDRYFFSSDKNSRALIRNGISRLWWFGYLTYDRSNAEDQFSLTKTLLEYQNTQAALLERAFGKSREVLKTCLRVLSEYMPQIKDNGGAAVVKEFGKYVNLIGGTYFLDTMDKTVLREKVATFIERKLQE